MQTQPDNWYRKKRIGGLWRFAIAITVLNILGHTVLGFEQAWATPFVALAAAYGTELFLEMVDALTRERPPRFLGSASTFIEFLLPAHISGLAVGMLLYSNERFWVIAFAAASAIASKYLFQAAVPTPGRPVSEWPRRHFFNPSNFGISLTLLLFTWVGIAPPYEFTENVRGVFDVILPLVIVGSGSIVNRLFTERIPLILAWLGGFILQALIRSLMHGTPLGAALAPMTGFAFVIFTFYMVTDPGSTPSRRDTQILFGLSVAIAYGLLVTAHIVFGLFFALIIVSILRGATMHFAAWRAIQVFKSGEYIGVAATKNLAGFSAAQRRIS
jgi:enediyne biosynthesis protein E5